MRQLFRRPPPEPAAAPRSEIGRRGLVLGHLAAGTVVVAAVVAEAVRPLAGDLGAPPSPRGWFDASYLSLVQGYNRPLDIAQACSLLIAVAVPAVVAWTRPGRALVERIIRVGAHGDVLAGAAVVVAILVVTDLVVLPLSWWTGFWREGAYGLRTQGLAGWARDWAVTHVPVWLSGAALAAAALALRRRVRPAAWPIVAGLGAACASALVILVAPLVLEPLLYNTAPLRPGPVRDEVERVLTVAGEGVADVVVADASRRSTRANAYVSGLGPTRRVVLYDTLVDRPPPEVGLVLAHELGHRRHRDVARGALGAAAGSVVVVYALAWFLRGAGSDPRAAARALAVVMALTVAGLPLQSWVSRRAEAAADLVALDLTMAPDVFARTNVALARSNLAEPLPPAWVRALWYSHPPVMARLEMSRRWPAVPRHRLGTGGPEVGNG